MEVGQAYQIVVKVWMEWYVITFMVLMQFE